MPACASEDACGTKDCVAETPVAGLQGGGLKVADGARQRCDLLVLAGGETEVRIRRISPGGSALGTFSFGHGTSTTHPAMVAAANGTLISRQETTRLVMEKVNPQATNSDELPAFASSDHRQILFVKSMEPLPGSGAVALGLNKDGSSSVAWLTDDGAVDGAWYPSPTPQYVQADQRDPIQLIAGRDEARLVAGNAVTNDYYIQRVERASGRWSDAKVITNYKVADGTYNLMAATGVADGTLVALRRDAAAVVDVFMVGQDDAVVRKVTLSPGLSQTSGALRFHPSDGSIWLVGVLRDETGLVVWKFPADSDLTQVPAALKVPLPSFTTSPDDVPWMEARGGTLRFLDFVTKTAEPTLRLVVAQGCGL
jgi:hypothetical protein